MRRMISRERLGGPELGAIAVEGAASVIGAFMDSFSVHQKGLDRQSWKAQPHLQKCSPAMQLNWDDLRYFLAVIDHGSTKRAAKALQVDQTTCARRIGALETSLGLRLFARDSGRYQPTQDALELIESVRTMNAAATALIDEAEGRKRARHCKIRVTSDEPLAAAIVASAVARFQRLRPYVQIEIDVSDKLRDLQAGEADIALRGGLEPNDPALIRRKLGDDPLGFYCTWDYPAPPLSRADLAGHPVACHGLVRDHFEAAGFGHYVKQVANSNTTLRAIVSKGEVIGVLPALVAEAPPPLRLCFPIDAPTGIWIVYAERLRGVQEVRQLGRLIAEEYRRSRSATKTG
ncbi:MAG TPA: LysR family transcriptional regulator [Sphingomicrobium sp.]|nr:LysR family transcriptional regulator [Sphingomicrobium sp.]